MENSDIIACSKGVRGRTVFSIKTDLNRQTPENIDSIAIQACTHILVGPNYTASCAPSCEAL